MPSRPVRDQWEYPRKMEGHFPIKPGQPIGMFISFPNSLIRAHNRFVKNGTANFGRNIPTEISGPPPEVIPNIPVGRNRNGPFHLNSDPNFRHLWHNGKHPLNSKGIEDGFSLFWRHWTWVPEVVSFSVKGTIRSNSFPGLCSISQGKERRNNVAKVYRGWQRWGTNRWILLLNHG